MGVGRVANTHHPSPITHHPSPNTHHPSPITHPGMPLASKQADMDEARTRRDPAQQASAGRPPTRAFPHPGSFVALLKGRGVVLAVACLTALFLLLTVLILRAD